MKLFKHQKEGIQFLVEAKRAILADEMGLGKTLQAIKAVSELGGQNLVICPASLKGNWEREIKNANPLDSVMVINGRTRPEGTYYKLQKWTIINYDITSYHVEWIKEKQDAGEIENIILDEAHYIKGKSSVRSKAVLEITENATGAVLPLTGTPLMNRPAELWNLLLAIRHPMTTVKGARTRFSTLYCGGHLQIIPATKWRPYPIRFWDESGATNLGMLRGELKGYMLRRKKDEVLDLPEKIVSVEEVEMTNDQQKIYDNAWEMYMEFLRQNPPDPSKMDNILMARHLIEIQKLKQISSRGKVKRMAEDVENAIEQGQKVIIFTQYVETLNMLKEETGKIKSDGKLIKIASISGATKAEDRQKEVDRFQQDEQCKVFIGNIKAAGVGITLTAASIVMFADMEWTPELHRQAEDRAHRIGQNGTVNVYYYVMKDTIDMDNMELLASKKKTIDIVIDGEADEIEGQATISTFLARMGRKAGL